MVNQRKSENKKQTLKYIINMFFIFMIIIIFLILEKSPGNSNILDYFIPNKYPFDFVIDLHAKER